MGHIAIDSPFFDPLADPSVLTLGKIQDTQWRLQLQDAGAIERQRDGVGLRLMAVPGTINDDRFRYWKAYTFSMGRWEFSADVDVDQVAVRFVLPDGELYEIPALPPGGDYRPRVPVRVLALTAASLPER